jgi:hypothetical protein
MPDRSGAGKLAPFLQMKIKYTGTPGENHQVIHMYGVDFPLGKLVPVTDPFAIRKLTKHPHFASQSEPSDEIEDAKIKHEFEAVANVVLQPVEELHVAEALAEGENNGNDHGSVAEDSAKAEGAGQQRTRGRGRPRKGA